MGHVSAARRHPSSVPSPRRRVEGLTLVELMVAIAVIAIVAAVAVPAFTEIATTHRLSSYASSLSASAQLARSEAIKLNRPVTMCRSASPMASAPSCAASGAWQQGWIVFRDDNGDGVVSSGDLILQRQEPLSADYSLTSDGANALIFQPSGVGATPANFAIYRALPTVGSTMRCVRVNVAGRVTVETASGTACTSS